MRKLRKICLFLHDTFKRLLEKLFGPWPKMGLSEYPGKEYVFNLQNQYDCTCDLFYEKSWLMTNVFLVKNLASRNFSCSK